ncbi:MAG: hypothetical protein HC870_01180, partial [Rhizobiales bacterium]|nr:hypothetical protein [Hyphomicrobiales bacterium]
MAGVAEARPVDPLTATIELGDAERFAALYQDTVGAPSVAQLQERYLASESRAIAIFTPYRIIDAPNLLANINANRADYTDAITRCLPLVKSTQPDLRAIYLGFRGLLPERPLPRIAVVLVPGTVAGRRSRTCRCSALKFSAVSPRTKRHFASSCAGFFAHETVHTFQKVDETGLELDYLLAVALSEGTADYIAQIVTGETPDPARAAWAEANASLVWREFAHDLAVVRDPRASEVSKNTAIRRWLHNADGAPDGWPTELGYWVGMQIAAGYVANASDPHTAIRELL